MVSAVTNTQTPTSASAQDASKLTGDYTTFLTLLTAQIKNQDPLSPMDTTQWTNQLVQYSGVEQQLKSNSYLEQLVNAGTAGAMNSAVSYIGKTVEADQPDAALSGGGPATWNYTLGGAAASATMTITDKDGNTVFAGPAPDLTAGTHTFTWNGKDSTGAQAADGDYTLKITATNGSTGVDATVGIAGTVTSAENDDGTVVLKVGGTSVPLSSVTKVS